MWTRFIVCFIVVELKINTLVYYYCYFFFIFPLSLIQGSPTFLNLRAASWVPSHVRGNQFASLSWDNNKLSQSRIIITDADHVKESSINISNDSTRLCYLSNRPATHGGQPRWWPPRPIVATRGQCCVTVETRSSALGSCQSFSFLMSWTWNFYYKRETLSLCLVSLFCTGNDAFSL